MFIAISTLLAFVIIACDIFIFRTLLRNKGAVARTLYIAQSVLLNSTILVIYLFRDFFTLEDGMMGLTTWLMWLYLTGVFTKVVLSLWLSIRWVLKRFYSHKKFRALLIAGELCALAVLLVMMWGAFFGRTTLRTKEVEIYSDKIPESFDGYTIAQFSDAHIGNFGSWDSLLEELVEAINSQEPDIVVQSGDLINMHSGELTEEYIDILDNIEAPVYAVLGNHDLSYYIGDTSEITPSKSIQELIAKQESMGWKMLNNERLWLRSGGDSIMLGGTVFPSNHPHNGARLNYGRSDLRTVMRGVSDSSYSVVIAHTPSLFDTLYNDVTMPDLMLSGHTHSMQTKFTIGDWQWSPASFAYERYSGLYEMGERKLYINDGLGFVGLAFRFGATPELTIIRLRSTKATNKTNDTKQLEANKQ